MSEDFDFKPLTEGLGFHKRVIDISDELNELNLTDAFQVVEPPARRTPSEMPPARFTDKMIPGGAPGNIVEPTLSNNPNPAAPIRSTPAVSRAAQAAMQAAELSWTPAASGTMQAPLSQIKSSKPQAPAQKGLLAKSQSATLGEEMFGIDFAKPLAKNLGQPTPVAQKIKQIKPISYNVAASIFDTGMVVMLTGVFAWAVFFITQIDAAAVLSLIRREAAAQVAAGVLLAAVFEFYAIISRVFFGRTFGEWTLGVRLGTPKQQLKWWYPFAVLFRSTLVLLTGLLTLPLLSTISRRDLAGTLSGISLYQES